MKMEKDYVIHENGTAADSRVSSGINRQGRELRVRRPNGIQLSISRGRGRMLKANRYFDFFIEASPRGRGQCTSHRKPTTRRGDSSGDRHSDVFGVPTRVVGLSDRSKSTHAGTYARRCARVCVICSSITRCSYSSSSRAVRKLIPVT